MVHTVSTMEGTSRSGGLISLLFVSRHVLPCMSICRNPPQQRSVRDLLSIKRGSPANLSPFRLAGTSAGREDSYIEALRHNLDGPSTVEGWAWDKSLVALHPPPLPARAEGLHEKGKPHSATHPRTPRANSSRARLHSFLRSATVRQATGSSVTMPRHHGSHSMAEAGPGNHQGATGGGGRMDASGTDIDRPSSPTMRRPQTLSATGAGTAVLARGVQYSSFAARSSVHQAVPEEEPLPVVTELRTASGSGVHMLSRLSDHMGPLAPRTHSLPGHTLLHSGENMAHYAAALHLRGHQSRLRQLRPAAMLSPPPLPWNAALASRSRSSGGSGGGAVLPDSQQYSRGLGVLGSRRYSSATGMMVGPGVTTALPGSGQPGPAMLAAAGATLPTGNQIAVAAGGRDASSVQPPFPLSGEHSADPTSFFMSQDPRVSSSQAVRSNLHATGASSMSASQMLALVLQASGRLNSGQSGLVSAGGGNAGSTSASFRGVVSPRGSEGMPSMLALRTAFASGNLRARTASRASEGWGGTPDARSPSCTQFGAAAPGAGQLSTTQATADVQSPPVPGRVVTHMVLPGGSHMSGSHMYDVGVSSGEESGGSSSHKPSPPISIPRPAAGPEVQLVSRHSSITAGSDRSVRGTTMMLLQRAQPSPPRVINQPPSHSPAAGLAVTTQPGPLSSRNGESWGVVSSTPAAVRQSGSSIIGLGSNGGLQAVVASGTASERSSPRAAGLASWRGIGASLTLQLHSSPSSASLGAAAADMGPGSLGKDGSRGLSLQGPGSHSARSIAAIHQPFTSSQQGQAIMQAPGVGVDEVQATLGAVQGLPEEAVLPETDRPTTRSHSLLTRHTLPPKVPRSQPSATNLGSRGGHQQQLSQVSQQQLLQQLASVTSSVQTPPPVSPGFARLHSTERSSFASSAFGAPALIISADGTAHRSSAASANLHSVYSVGHGVIVPASTDAPGLETLTSTAGAAVRHHVPESPSLHFQPALAPRPSNRDTPWLGPGNRPVSHGQAQVDPTPSASEINEIQACGPKAHADHSTPLQQLQLPSQSSLLSQLGGAELAGLPPALNQSISIATAQQHVLAPVPSDPMQLITPHASVLTGTASDTANAHSASDPSAGLKASDNTILRKPPPAPARTRSRTSLHQAASSLFAHASFTMGRMYSKGFGGTSMRGLGPAVAGHDVDTIEISGQGPGRYVNMMP
jgi:hypothetical protein